MNERLWIIGQTQRDPIVEEGIGFFTGSAFVQAYKSRKNLIVCDYEWLSSNEYFKRAGIYANPILEEKEVSADFKSLDEFLEFVRNRYSWLDRQKVTVFIRPPQSLIRKNQFPDFDENDCLPLKIKEGKNFDVRVRGQR